MRFPTINKQPKRRVDVPSFTGGINLRDRISMCGDNQLTDLKNMFYKNGTFKTRPGIKYAGRNYSNIESKPKQHFGDIRAFTEIQYERKYNGELCTYVLETMMRREESSGDDAEAYDFIILFRFNTHDDVIDLPELTVTDTEEEMDYFVIQHGDFLFCFLGNRTIKKLEYANQNAVWQDVLDNEIYIPTIATNCTGTSKGKLDSDSLLSDAVLLESFNMIGRCAKLEYSTVDINRLKTADKHTMEYYVPFLGDARDYITTLLKVEIKKGDKTFVHTANLKSDDNVFYESLATIPNDNLQMRVLFSDLKNGVGQITFYKVGVNITNFTEIATVKEGDYVLNDMVITIPVANSEENMNKIFKMKQSEWFGGAVAGLEGGTRLFLGANTADNEGALVCWSALNNPLYFPENCYFYVGNIAERVTGFGRQSDLLIIFKENETWYTKYQQNSNISSDDLLSSAIVDLQASSVYFPLVQINSRIGCAYPHTVQLCRNRLIFVGADKKVYTLVSESQYNERSIFCISEMVEAHWKNKQIYSACDWNGYYCLFTNDNMYLCDYNSYGYQYIQSYSKNEDSNLKIPWYIWDVTGGVKYAIGDTLIISSCFVGVIDPQNTSIQSFIINEANPIHDEELFEESEDGYLNVATKKIQAIAQTKIFDFGNPNYYKNIDSVGLSLGYNASNEITVTFITDGGEEQTAVLLDDPAQKRDANFTKSVIIMPCIRAAAKFGVRFECNGDMIIDGMSIDYTTTGRAI